MQAIMKSAGMVFLLVLLVCSTALSSDKKPLWVENPGFEFPSEMYIVSVGSGFTAETARNNALNGIAQVFKVDIKSQQNLVEQYYETGAGKDLTLTQTHDMTKKISVATDQSLRNVIVDKTWNSEENKRHYALAYIDRSQSTPIYLENASSVDEEVAAAYAGYEKASSKLSKLAYLNKAVDKSVYRDILMQQLTTLSLGSASYSVIVPPADLISARQELKGQIRVALELGKLASPEFEGSVKEVLQKFGFSVVTSEPDIIVSGNLEIEEISLPREGKFVRWFFSLDMRKAVTQEKFLTYSDDGREGHVTLSEAKRRALRATGKKIGSNFHTRIDKYLTSLVSSE